MKRFLWIFVIAVFCLAGCGAKPRTAARVVTRVDVFAADGRTVTYTHPDTIQKFLMELRLRPDAGTLMHPAGSCILVMLSDGSCHIYDRRGDRFLFPPERENNKTAVSKDTAV